MKKTIRNEKERAMARELATLLDQVKPLNKRIDTLKRHFKSMIEVGVIETDEYLLTITKATYTTFDRDALELELGTRLYAFTRETDRRSISVNVKLKKQKAG